MSDMTLERFTEILDAYGADPARWPEGERAAATAFAEARQDLADPLLAQAASLDIALGGHALPTASDALAEKIAGSARMRNRAKQRDWRGLIWRGLGFAGVTLAGATAGALLVATLMPMSMPGDEDHVITAFDSAF